MKATNIMTSDITKVQGGNVLELARQRGNAGEVWSRVLADVARWLMALAVVAILSSCTSVAGYPRDYVSGQADAVAFAAYFRPAPVEKYLAATDEKIREKLRNRIVYGRLAYYDLKYSEFVRSINTESNSLNAGGSLAAITLTGIGAVTGTAATKSALSAASTAVLGGIGQVDKNLFYEKTMPALIAAMDATRAKTLLQISRGLQDSDDEYPLAAAFIDLNRYRDAGSIPSAIGTVGAAAEVMKIQTYNQISSDRS
ncbi:hypothetical protein [Mesorhizobium sp. M0618]|uniref:hypothetical protein n=1 Tax=unclassified Mesorhizobium TaxID=325217 RepID=UPI003335675C